MRRLLSMVGIGLCMGLAGCAGTQQRLALGPGNQRGGFIALAHAHAPAPPPCGCGRTARPMPPPPAASPSPSPSVALVSAPSSPPPPLPSARFFPLFDEQNGAPADPLENPRPDWLGVRTVLKSEQPLPPTSRDGATERVSAEEATPAPAPPSLPVVMKVGAPRPEEGGTTVAEVAPSPPLEVPAEGLTAVPPSGTVPFSPAPGLPVRPGSGLTLEYEDDAVLAGRPRLASDGSVRREPPRGSDPVRYGPEPTYPAAYYPAGTAPTSVPKTREVWAFSRPAGPSLLARLWQRFRKTAPDGGSGAAAAP